MKKFVSIALVAALAVSLVACGSETTSVSESTETSVSESTEASVSESTETSVSESVEETTEGAETIALTDVSAMENFTEYSEYVEAAVDTEVNVMMYVQATQSWWDGKISVYGADNYGAYFVYNMTCTEEDAAKLTPGTAILVTGYKAEWSGEVEIAEGATFKFVEGADPYIAEAVDVTDLIGTDELINYQNQLVSFTDMTVEKVSYKNDTLGDDIYVTLAKDGVNVEFCLEYYLNGSDEEFYNLVANLAPDATVDVEGYLYWYEGADTHLTKVTVK